jgi:hypothetical protein
MSITFICRACGHHLSVADEMAGKSGKCPHCHTPLRVPRPAQNFSEAPVPSPVDTDPVAPALKTAPPPAPRGQGG